MKKTKSQQFEKNADRVGPSGPTKDHGQAYAKSSLDSIPKPSGGWAKTPGVTTIRGRFDGRSKAGRKQ